MTAPYDTLELIRRRDQFPASRLKLIGGDQLGFDVVSKPEIDTGRMTLTYVISTADIDRQGDKVLQEGINWTKHAANPVVLLSHKMDQPIGLARDPQGRHTVSLRDGKTYGTVWLSNDLMSSQVFALAKDGFLAAASIGFSAKPPHCDLETVKTKEGWEYTIIKRCIPHEFSLTSIGANSETTLQAAEILEKGLCGKPLDIRLKHLFSPLPQVAWSHGWTPSITDPVVKQFKEDDHPRDHGKFSSKSGGSGGEELSANNKPDGPIKDANGDEITPEEIEAARNDYQEAKYLRQRFESGSPERDRLDEAIGDTPDDPWHDSKDKSNSDLPDQSRPKLNYAEKKAVFEYTGEDYDAINSSLRKTGKLGDGQAADLQRAILKSPVFDEPVTVTRGIELEGDDLDEFVKYCEDGKKNGEPVEHRGFVSTTTEGSFAGNVKMTIHARQGLDATRYGNGTGELLLPALSEFKVLAVKRKGDNVHIELEQIVGKEKRLWSRDARRKSFKESDHPRTDDGKPEITNARLKYNADKFSRPENYDKLRELPDGRELWIGANDWENGFSWAWIVSPEEAVSVKDMDGMPDSFLMIDHAKCPGCHGKNGEPYSDKKKLQECRDYAGKMVDEWASEQVADKKLPVKKSSPPVYGLTWNRDTFRNRLKAFDETRVVRHDTGKFTAPAPVSFVGLMLTGEAKQALLILAGQVRDEDLAEDGREESPHVTVRYGLLNQSPNEIKKLVRNFGPLSVRIGKLSVFPATDDHPFDVVKAEITGESLVKLHHLLGRLPHKDSYPEFKPHATIAYVKPGLGANYAATLAWQGMDFVGNKVQFSNAAKAKTDLPLGRAKVVPVVKSVGTSGLRWSMEAFRLKMFSESDHPRADDGKFGSGGGSSGKGPPPLPKKPDGSSGKGPPPLPKKPDAGSSSKERPKPPANQGDLIKTAERKASHADLNDPMGKGVTDIAGQNIPDAFGDQFDAHGTGDLASLAKLLNGGIDPTREFYSAPLSSAGKEQYGQALKESSPFIVLGHPGQTLKEGGIAAVAVDGHYEDSIPELSKAFPGVKFVPAKDLHKILPKITTAKHPPVRYGKKSLGMTWSVSDFRLKEFREDDHPRNHGEFAKKPGSSGSSGKPKSKDKAKEKPGSSSKKPKPKASPKKSPVPSAKVPEQKPRSEKAERAANSAVRVDKTIQRYAEEYNEPRMAKAMKGVSLPDGEPVDVIVPNNKGVAEHGIELKTMVANGNFKLTMDRYAQVRKIVWERAQSATFHTIVSDDHAVFNANGEGEHDDSKRVYYYRRGVAGSARVANMHQCQTLEEVQELMAMDEGELPAAAQRTDSQLRVGKWKFITDADGKGYKNSKTGEIVRPKK